MDKKRIKSRKKRANTRAKIVQGMTQNILDNLARLAKDLIPPQIVKTHTEYYFTCNPAEQMILLKIFKQREDKIQTDIAEYYNEKRYRKNKR